MDLISFLPRAVMQGIPLLYGSTGEILTELVEGKYRKYFLDPDDRRTIEKGKAALVRQGYRFGEINAAVRAFLEEQLEEE